MSCVSIKSDNAQLGHFWKAFMKFIIFMDPLLLLRDAR